MIMRAMEHSIPWPRMQQLLNELLVALAGFDGIQIGETITSAETPQPLPPLRIDEPTISMIFSVNTSPFAGREGKYVPIAETIRGFKEIAEGKHDGVPEQAF